LPFQCSFQPGPAPARIVGRRSSWRWCWSLMNASVGAEEWNDKTTTLQADSLQR
jgi:hypothetical protein